MDNETVANPGSNLGEAIGASIEADVNRLLLPIAEKNDCKYLTVGPIYLRTGKPTKLLLIDAFGNEV